MSGSQSKMNNNQVKQLVRKMETETLPIEIVQPSNHQQQTCSTIESNISKYHCFQYIAKFWPTLQVFFLSMHLLCPV